MRHEKVSIEIHIWIAGGVLDVTMRLPELGEDTFSSSLCAFFFPFFFPVLILKNLRLCNSYLSSSHLLDHPTSP